MRILVTSAASAMLFGSASHATAGEVIKVAIRDMAFSPAEITARVGDTVEWSNADFLDLTATAIDGGWDVVLPAGQKGTVELKVPGTVTYICRLHPNMTGTIRVSPAGPH
jgi:plastocyanin